MTKEELTQKYVEKFGKKPFSGWSEEKIKAKLEGTEVEDEVQPKSKKEKKEKGSDPVMDFEIDPDKVYEFELQKRTQARHNIPTTARVWCEATGTVRDIRFCKTEDSPYVDEQSEDARTERELIRFSSKTLNIPGKEEAKIRYLLAYDGNADKKQVLPSSNVLKGLYKLKDHEAEDKQAIEYFKAKKKAADVVENAKEEDLKVFMQSRFGLKSERSDEILKEAYRRADSNPMIFINGDFNNPKHAVKALVQDAVSQAKLVVETNEVKYKTGAVVFTFDQSRHTYDEALARWVMEGSKEAKEFEKMLKSKD